MPKNTEKELLKDRFGAYVKVSILHVRKKIYDEAGKYSSA